MTWKLHARLSLFFNLLTVGGRYSGCTDAYKLKNYIYLTLKNCKKKDSMCIKYKSESKF